MYCIAALRICNEPRGVDGQHHAILILTGGVKSLRRNLAAVLRFKELVDLSTCVLHTPFAKGVPLLTWPMHRFGIAMLHAGAFKEHFGNRRP